MNYSDKEFLAIGKAIFYQLFSRKMPYVVIQHDSVYNDTFMFSNVDNETMLIYDENPKYCFHKVVVHDKKFLEDFYERFSILSTYTCYIRVVDFFATLAKNKDLNDAKLEVENEIIYMTHVETSKFSDAKETFKSPVGILLSEIEADMYFHIWQSGIVKSDDPYMFMLDKDEYTDDESKYIVLQDIAHPTEKIPAQHAVVILNPGFNIPTVHSFIKSMKNQNPYVRLVCGYDVNCIVQNYEYETPLLTSYGTHPAQRWFARDRR